MKKKKLSHSSCKEYNIKLNNKLSEYDNFNNIYFEPTKVNNFRITYPVIKKINLLNDHNIERRSLVQSDGIRDIYLFVKPKPILLHINSNEQIKIIDVLPLMDTIILSGIPIFTMINGVCKDGILLPFLVGKKRYMYEHSHVYITKTFYEQSSGVTIEDKMINLNAFRNRITNIFKKYTKLPDEIYKILFKREIFFNAEECLKYGIIDEII